jgi:hypothetical protein
MFIFDCKKIMFAAAIAAIVGYGIYSATRKGEKEESEGDLEEDWAVVDEEASYKALRR